MGKREHAIFINQYYRKGDVMCPKSLAGHYKNPKLVHFLKNLQPFEEPDMYSIVEDEVYILEHFEFDASKRTRKGMKGIMEDNKVEEALQEFYKSSNNTDDFSEAVCYIQTPESYLENFKTVYQHHYSRIPKYKKNLHEAGIITNDTSTLVGFFIENKYPPYYRIMVPQAKQIERGFEELDLLYTKQFIDLFTTSPDLDFVLFGGLFDGENRLMYCDKSIVGSYREMQINLDNVDFLKNTDVVWGGKFEIQK